MQAKFVELFVISLHNHILYIFLGVGIIFI